jgi:hypothetical protein
MDGDARQEARAKLINILRDFISENNSTPSRWKNI